MRKEAVGEWWKLSEGGDELLWEVEPGQVHEDHIEMSGERVSAIVRYGVEERRELRVSRHVVWPGLRTVPNDTHGSLAFTFTGPPPGLRPGLNEIVKQFRLCGMIHVESVSGSLKTLRWFFPSVDKPIYFELAIIENVGTVTQLLDCAEPVEATTTPHNKGVSGSYRIDAFPIATGEVELPPGDSALRAVAYRARRASEMEEYVDADEALAELDRRRALVDRVFKSDMQFDCPKDPHLSALFRFAQLRAVESVFRTRGGLMHSPGGGAYYAAVWANDQAEYAAPFFGLLAGSSAFDATVNMFRMYKKFVNSEFRAPPSSIIAEGTDYFSCNGDRGDAAMVAYGVGRFALLSGDRGLAEELWPMLEWCLEFCARQLSPQGVVKSNTDELEGRFPTGDANLFTSALVYDALTSAGFLADELGRPAETFRARADALKRSIEAHFGATVEGFDTYRYFDGCTVLRSWVCVPMTMGIYDRVAGTMDALFSDRLWTPDGLKTTSNTPVFWDRATLYCLRGVFAAGMTSQALEHLVAYTRRRLLGSHVPYPVEAYPEGNQRHLSAESALYCRVVTEGLLGIRPVGLRSFRCAPRMPAAWDEFQLRGIRAFGAVFDLAVSRSTPPSTLSVQLALHSEGKDTKPQQQTYSVDASSAFGVLITVPSGP